MEVTMFEQAARLKLRFPSPQGTLAAEDLWDLPLRASSGRANLNDIAKSVNKQLKDSGETDFVTPGVGTDAVMQLRLDIVKHVIATVQAQQAAAKELADRRDKKARILELIAHKQDEALAGQSLEELQALAESL